MHSFGRTRQRLLTFARSRYFIPSLMMLGSLTLVAYAVTSISVTNSVTITSGASVQIIYQNQPFAGTACPTTGYSSNPTGVSLVEPAGGSTNAYLCIHNVGTGTDSPTIAITQGDPDNCGTGSSPCFTISPSSLLPIQAGGFSDPATLTISNSFTTSQSSAIDITVTIT